MKTDTNATTATPTINPDFDAALAAAKARPELPESQELLADQCDWNESKGRLTREIAAQLESNAPMAMTVSPRVCGEVWRYAAYVAERESIDLHQAVAHLLEMGMAADSSETREALRAAK